ncbi:hypothetical protein H5V45_20005 [Nocardioides sp. KIGAM211]|uniref:Uncharacterized protein n=1 Tax=Nocardioides luti TaxID=2761101 RepID=A0A7X0RJR2_9ACTN|nr:hypothetical protein [Nocardioides luti]MBB6629613.1 hypothetical protein [Nocardioides luti]
MRPDRAPDGDFAAYVAARWPTLVRTLVLLGAPQPAAEAATRSALARCHRRWSVVQRGEDLDAEVYAALLDSWARLRLRVPAAREVEPDHEPGPGDEADPQPLAALEHDLDRLTRDGRAAVVLRHVAGLDDRQVALVLGRHVPPERGDEDTFREAAETVEVLAPPLPAVVAEGRAQRRRTVRLTAYALAGLLVVVGLATWLGTRSSPEPAPADAPPRVTRVESAAGTAWWANGVLHLAHVEVELPRVVGLVGIDDGAVYADDRGRVFAVTADGAVREIGRTGAGQPIVASDESGLAAWIDVQGDSLELVAFDVAAGKELGRRSIVVDREFLVSPRPIALDGDTLYYADASGEREWQVRDDVGGAVAGRGLVAAVQKTLVFQISPRTIQIVQPFFSVTYAVPGDGAQLSPDAAYALTRRPGSGGDDQFGRVRIYDARSGERAWTGLRAGDIAVAASLGADDEVHYVVAREQDLPGSGEFVRSSFSGPYELRTCRLRLRSCTTVLQFPHTGQLPVLAR